ncbi:MAG: acetoacetyl-CoA synthetase [Acidimicrobiaceae bacterium]|nr:acetoacetyl-CoA synthetase [Acidimicrobiaceae bacterium]
MSGAPGDRADPGPDGPGAPFPPEMLWSPPPGIRRRSRIGAYLGWLEHRGRSFASYDDLWRWSVEDLEGFWGSVWEFFGVSAHRPPGPMLAGDSMPGARWCPGVTLNYAEHALRPGPDPGRVAVVAQSQSRGPVTWTVDELRDQVGRARRGLQRLGVGPGDRVAAYLPNIPETLAAFLATASLGAIWSSCAPEFGTRSVIDRFSQVSPAVLLCVDGYRYGAASVSRTAEVAAIREALPSLTATVIVPYLAGAEAVPDAVSWSWLVGEAAPLEFTPVPFDHPLYVLYSSGTTGLPKPIVHGHGGILLEHLKALALHADLGAGDRFFWFTTTGWMMWNLLVSGLLVESAVVLFDGNPGYPDLSALWRLAEETGTTYFGVSAPFLMSCRKAGVVPSSVAWLGALRGVGSTGSPLPAEGFRWVYASVGSDLLLASVSGGTDVCTAFVGGCPLVPVYAGEISCRYLGAAVAAFSASGAPCGVGEQGELVVTRPMPSMPVGFWGDEDGSRYQAAYFDEYPGVWRHGDWITFTERGTCVISGRSDATLNRGGVRVGTAEFYSVVESLPEVADSLVVHLEDPSGDGPGELLLFVVVAPGAVLDEALQGQIVASIRANLSPRHAPDQVYAVPAIPRTLSGKKLEVPVKRILTGTAPDQAASRGALADPGALAPFEELARHR